MSMDSCSHRQRKSQLSIIRPLTLQLTVTAQTWCCRQIIIKYSFYKAGEYNDAVSAATAYDNLKSATVSEAQWEGLGSPVMENQIWIYRSGTNHYAKFRIISTKTGPGQVKPYAECKFEWEYQPDGTLTFPGK